jgi:trans-aconitate methyltransferase
MMKDWDPDSYGQVNTLQQLVAERALADLVLEGDERVLDVGCGDGNVTCGCLTFGTSSSTPFKHFPPRLD